MRKNLRNKPHKARATGCGEAWWYENGSSIDVFCYTEGLGHGSLSCRIPKAQIKAWLRRAETTNSERQDT